MTRLSQDELAVLMVMGASDEPMTYTAIGRIVAGDHHGVSHLMTIAKRRIAGLAAHGYVTRHVKYGRVALLEKGRIAYALALFQAGRRRRLHGIAKSQVSDKVRP